MNISKTVNYPVVYRNGYVTITKRKLNFSKISCLALEKLGQPLELLEIVSCNTSYCFKEQTVCVPGIVYKYLHVWLVYMNMCTQSHSNTIRYDPLFRYEKVKVQETEVI